MLIIQNLILSKLGPEPQSAADAVKWQASITQWHYAIACSLLPASVDISPHYQSISGWSHICLIPISLFLFQLISSLALHPWRPILEVAGVLGGDNGGVDDNGGLVVWFCMICHYHRISRIGLLTSRGRLIFFWDFQWVEAVGPPVVA